MSNREDHDEIDQAMGRALAHPMRVLILRMLEEGISSPNQLAKRIEEPLGNVSYHFKVLNKCGCLELVETRPARGAVEHFYKLKPHRAIGSGASKELPPALQTHYAGTALAGFTQRAIAALDAGTVAGRTGSGLTWFPVNVDEQGWKELCRILASVEDRFRAVAAKSSERVESADDELSVMVAVAAFELGDGEGVDPS